MAVILLTTFSNTFSWLKMIAFWFKFHWNLFPIIQLTTSHRGFRKWHGTCLPTNYHRKQRWRLLMHKSITRPWRNSSNAKFSSMGELLAFRFSVWSYIQDENQGLLWVWAQPMRDDITSQRRLSLTKPIPRLIIKMIIRICFTLKRSWKASSWKTSSWLFQMSWRQIYITSTPIRLLLRCHTILPTNL